MITLEVTSDDRTGLAGMITGLREQLPYAYALALNDTVNQAQSAIQSSLRSDFTLRHDRFIADTIYRKPGQDFATKANLAAAVRVNPDRDFLRKFEDDSVKTARGGGMLTVPIIRLSSPALIVKRGDPLDPKHILALINSQGGKNVGPFRKRGAKKAAAESFFLLKSKAGKTLIMQRVGGQLRVLYAFEQSVPITSHRLHFEEIAMATALERFDPNMTRALEYAIETMR